MIDGQAGGGGSRSPRPVPAVLAVIAACYLTGLLVANLSGSGLTLFGLSISRVVDTLFPRVVPANRLDTVSINEAWAAVQGQYVIRDLSGSVGTVGAERGIAETLNQRFGDRFTRYETAEEFAAQEQGLSGQRNGSIGIALEPRCAGVTICASGANPTLVALEEVLRGQPADKAGLRNGDILVAVDGRSLDTLGSTATDRVGAAARLIRGTAGTAVHLSVQRGAQRIEVTVVRADLHLPSVFSARMGTVLYVQITGFDTKTGSDLRDQLQSGLQAGVTGVVLDLRGNGGGFVTEAQTVASQFLRRIPGRQETVVTRRGRMSSFSDPSSAQQVESDAIQDGGVALTPRLTVLVDGDTASAAEIVTAALHDYHRATLVGEKTFGKGSVQLDFPLPDGSDLHLTIERWFGPAGESIEGKGIAPDRAVALPSPDSRYRLDAQSPDPSADAQLQAALAPLR